MIDDLAAARALHVLAVAHWIGGVAFVTLVALPLARAQDEAARGWALFESIERRFARQVRWSIPIAGASGLWMTWRYDAWSRFAEPDFWWMHAMLGLWALFMLVVFVAEPLAHPRLARLAAAEPEAVLRRLSHAHRVLLVLAAVTVVGAVAGAHGGLVN